jgi:hypothetical protein
MLVGSGIGGVLASEVRPRRAAALPIEEIAMPGGRNRVDGAAARESLAGDLGVPEHPEQAAELHDPMLDGIGE